MAVRWIAWAALCALMVTAVFGRSRPGTDPAQAAGVPTGKQIYDTNCATCHGGGGQGLPGGIPPLANNPYVAGDARKVVHTLLYGLSGPISVKGARYDGVMPAWRGQLSSAEIAAVASFVRASWGNRAAPVSPAFVASVKK